MCMVRALRMRIGLGGGWSKPGPLAAAALVAMEDAAERFQKDHEHAKTFAKGCNYYTVINHVHYNNVHILDGLCKTHVMQ